MILSKPFQIFKTVKLLVCYLILISGQFFAVTDTLATELNDLLIFFELTLRDKVVIFNDL